jgi:hypothetical protein
LIFLPANCRGEYTTLATWLFLSFSSEGLSDRSVTARIHPDRSATVAAAVLSMVEGSGSMRDGLPPKMLAPVFPFSPAMRLDRSVTTKIVMQRDSRSRSQRDSEGQ